jgi:hypothetical protein
MFVRVGDAKQKTKTIREARKAGLRIESGELVTQAFDGEVLVVAVVRVKARVFAFRYNPAYYPEESLPAKPV